MIGMKNEQDIQSSLQNRVRFVLGLGALKHHVQKVSSVAQIRIRISKRETLGEAIGERGQRRHFGH